MVFFSFCNVVPHPPHSEQSQMTFCAQSYLSFFIVDERSSTIAREHARKWTGSIDNAADRAFVKEFPHPMHTAVSVCARPIALPDAAIIVLGPEHTHAFAKTNCVLAGGAPVGIIVDCLSPDELSPHSLKELSELAAKHSGLVAAFSMSHRTQVDAFFHQMIFLARFHSRSTRKLRFSRFLQRSDKRPLSTRCTCVSLAIAIIMAFVYCCR